MVAKSPDTRRAQSDYENGWLAINRLIRGESSWSGRERDLFYLNLGDGRFVDASGVTGLDFPEDGRAFSVLDLDADGDLDLLLKNRNAPQLRILRNDTATDHHSLAFRLIGRRSNRDAVGAVITLETGDGQRTKQVQLGKGFLSQSSSRLYFGLGEKAGPFTATIVWPSGDRQSLTELPAGHLVTVVEGQQQWSAEPFRPRNHDGRVCAPQKRLAGVRPEGYALIDPVPVPPFQLDNLQGQAVSSAALHGRPLLLNFWATWCAPCQEEMRLWKQHYRELTAAGAELVAVSVDEPAQAAQVDAFVQERALPFPVLRMDAGTLERYNIFYQRLFQRRSDLQIPTTFLLNERGELVKLYRGVVPIDTLLADLKTLGSEPAKLAQTALPLAGRRFQGVFRRDYYFLGAAFFEREQVADARVYLEKAVSVNPSDHESWDSLGVVYGQLGKLEEARRAFEQAVSLRPDYAGGHFNLGIAYLRQQQPQKAEQAFARAAELDPGDPSKLLQYGMALASNGKLREAIRPLERYLSLEPQDSQAHNELGTLYANTGDLIRATESFRR
ncbi:MAG: tetratricopeptide repeat protein, partial [Terriglobia bacterium]